MAVLTTRPCASPQARAPGRPRALLTLTSVQPLSRRRWTGQAAAAATEEATTKSKETLVSDLLVSARARDESACRASASALATLAGPGPPPPAPSTWRTLFTTSTGPSGGKVGPFQGETTQAFHASPVGPASAGTYTNKLAFGGSLACLELSGTWEAVRDDRVNVVFVNTKWSLLGGAFKGGSAFPADKQPRGHWSLLFGDEAVRVFTTNKGSLFVLERA